MSTENRTFGSVGSKMDPNAFVDRRENASPEESVNQERRQFSDSHDNLSPEAAELGKAIDQYKLINRRRYVTYEEILNVIKSLGYSK